MYFLFNWVVKNHQLVKHTITTNQVIQFVTFLSTSMEVTNIAFEIWHLSIHHPKKVTSRIGCISAATRPLPGTLKPTKFLMDGNGDLQPGF